MDNTDSYVVWDIPGVPVSVVLNLELVDALNRSFQSRRGRKHNGPFGILLGRSSLTASNRALLTIEDCHPITGEHDGIPEGTDALTDVGLVTEDEVLGGERDGLILVVRRVRKDVPVARLIWCGEHTDMPLDSRRLERDGFTILRGSPALQQPFRKPRRAEWRRFAWIPLLAGVAACVVVALWPEHESEEPIPPEMAASAEPATPPKVSPEPQDVAAPKPVVRPRRAETPRRPAAPTVTVEFHLAPESAARRIVNRVPALPLLRRFQVKDDQDFVAPNPLRQPKPSIPADLARRFPGESRVDLRVAIDKAGQVSHIGELGPTGNPEFVNLARAAVSGWAFEPARLHDRPVSSALDVTFRFRNPAAAQPEAGGTKRVSDADKPRSPRSRS